MPKPATAKQQRYLRRLASQTGTSFASPASSIEASREIDRMLTLGVSPRHEQHADRDAIARRDGARDTGPRAGEITGYGSSARWAAGGR